jgi:hypothetical protein
MIRIVITSPDIREMKGVGKTSGKPYHMRFQIAHAFVVSPDGAVAEFPDKFEIILDADQVPFQRGKYQLAPSSMYVSRDGRLECKPRLIPETAK